ncbi:uncharacterized protein [Temnothorax longispinosus]|uniref:uncharacterized protein n=1 Tax=Temnothorax longispinosus TaxID=300112 RepID=UPI003A9A297A
MTRVYPGCVKEPRTLRQHEVDCEIAMQTRTTPHGVKGPSVLMLLPVFDITSSFTLDYLHNGLLGVAKTFADAWFHSSNHEKDWYIGNKVDLIDEKLLRIKPPCEITRTPRSISERNLWKASEWKHFLLYYSLICLQNVMPLQYVKHWFLFVFSMHIFLQEKISDVDVLTATRALEMFVLKIEDLYGLEYYKFNVHLLLHIPEFVKQFGALWATSTFPYEHYNGVLRKMFRNSQAVPEQICKLYMRSKRVESLCLEVFSRPDCFENAKILYDKISGTYHTKNYLEYGPYLKIFGKPVQRTLTLMEQTCIETLLHENILNESVCYKRFIFRNVLWHAENYEKFQKRQNSTVLLHNGMFIIISGIFGVRTVPNNYVRYVIIGKILNRVDVEICKTNNPTLSSNRFFHITRMTDSVVAVFPDMLNSKCVKILYDIVYGP